MKKKKKDKKTGEKKSRKKKVKDGPKGYLPPETGPKIDFLHKNCQ